MKVFRVNDIFYSLQGEGYNTGRAAMFVRFAGCNLRCPFCDTEFDSFREMTGEEIVDAISRYEVRGTRCGDCRWYGGTVVRGCEDSSRCEVRGTRYEDSRGYEDSSRCEVRGTRYENSSEAELSGVQGNLALPYPRTPVPPTGISPVPPTGITPVPPTGNTPVPPILVVLTGGEPTLQVDEAFVDLLHRHGFEVAMESNGTRPAPQNLDWLTVSPKGLGSAGVWGYEGARYPDELKIIFDENTDPEAYLVPPHPRAPVPPPPRTPAPPYPRTPEPPYPRTPEPPYPLLYLQPCDTGDAERNARIINRCVDYIKAHPQWRLSLQTHKLVGFK